MIFTVMENMPQKTHSWLPSVSISCILSAVFSVMLMVEVQRSRSNPFRSPPPPGGQRNFTIAANETHPRLEENPYWLSTKRPHDLMMHAIPVKPPGQVCITVPFPHTQEGWIPTWRRRPSRPSSSRNRATGWASWRKELVIVLCPFGVSLVDRRESVPDFQGTETSAFGVDEGIGDSW